MQVAAYPAALLLTGEHDPGTGAAQLGDQQRAICHRGDVGRQIGQQRLVGAGERLVGRPGAGDQAALGRTVGSELHRIIYLFQDYHTDYLCWVDWTSTSPYQDGKVNAAAFKVSFADVQIGVTEDEEGNLTVPVIEFVKAS